MRGCEEMLPRPGGIYAESYEVDAAWIRTRGERLVLAILITGPLALPLLAGRSLLGIVTVMLISLISVLGLFITTGMAGQINLGQAAFMGVGAYSTAALARMGCPFWAAVPLGGIGAALFGCAFGIPALRVKGFYLALSTVAAQFVFEIGIVRLPKDLFGGTQGLSVASMKLLGRELASDTALYYIVLAYTAIMLYGAYNLTRTRVGRAFVAIRDNDIAAEIMGVNLVRYKLAAFMMGAFYGGVAGGLWAYYTRFVLADQFNLWQSLWYVGMLIVGGTNSVLGAILGTLAIRGLEQGVTILGPALANLFPQLGSQGWYAAMNVLLGSAIILVLLFEPRGLAHRWNILRSTYGIWPFPHKR